MKKTEDFRLHLQRMGHFDLAEEISKVTELCEKPFKHVFIERPDPESYLTRWVCEKCGEVDRGRL